MTVQSFTAMLLNNCRRIVLVLAIMFPTLSLSGQFKSIGVPEIWNIGRSEYRGGTKNWNIVDDEQGNIYVANNNGILRFDGEDRETFPASNNSIVRSLAFGSDNRLYVGAYNEIGVLDRSAETGIRYSSLNHLIPENARNFDDVWNIYQTRFGVVFQSFESIFIYKNNTVHVIRPGERFGNSFYVKNNYYVVEVGVGLRMLVDGGLETITDDSLFTQDEIQSLTPVNANDLLVGTMNNGLFVLSGQTMQPWDTEISEELKKSKLYCGSVHKSTFMFGTIKSGLFVVNERGEIREHLNRSNGLQNNTVLSLFVDRQDNVWLGLDIGIDFLKSSLPTSVINDGLIIFEKGRDGRWKFRNRVQGFDISSKDLILRNNNWPWMSHGYLGLFHIHINESLDSVILVREYRGTGNLHEELPYILHTRSDDFFISTSQGIYQFDEQKELFYKPEELNEFFNDFTLIYFLKEDRNRNLWYSAREGMGVFRLLEDGTFTNISTPFLDLNDTRVSPFDNIYIQDPANIFIGTQKGLVHYDPSIYKNYFNEMHVYLNRVTVSSKREDSLYYFSCNSHLAEREIDDQFALPWSWNNISFRFNSPDMENAGHIEYSYRLMNFDDDWSDWSMLNSKEYTNLHDGDYCFEVKARNIYGNVSAEDSFCFTVEPPFSRSYKALILYFLLFSAIILASAYLYLRRIERVRLQEKNRQLNAFKKTEQTLEEQKLAAEAEVMQLKNERLQSEMKHKNKELTSAAYHIIQKNKFLNSLKQELSALIQNAKNESVVADLKKISRKIDRDIQNEKSWEVFDRYFDEVHQEFHSRLRNLHPELTPGELRLCSYLRMNVTTKEIAPLMNISIRGVEISRYRLRKKLKLDQSANLVDYLMQI
jgi:DNA-binding CsgD family transcriptional regulator